MNGSCVLQIFLNLMEDMLGSMTRNLMLLFYVQSAYTFLQVSYKVHLQFLRGVSPLKLLSGKISFASNLLDFYYYNIWLNLQEFTYKWNELQMLLFVWALGIQPFKEFAVNFCHFAVYLGLWDTHRQRSHLELLGHVALLALDNCNDTAGPFSLWSSV